MASRIMSFLFLSVSYLSPLDKDFALQSQFDSQYFHTVQLSSLLPSSTCTRSSIVRDHKSSMEVIHKYGPCSDLSYNDNLNFTERMEQTLRQDKLRAEYIYSLVFPKKYSVGGNGRPRFQQKLGATTLPVKPSSVLRGGDAFYVTVGLGTPAKSLSLQLDSATDLTWTQCTACQPFNCFFQVEPRFNPSASSSYANVPCTSPYCTYAAQAHKTSCSNGNCIFHGHFEDQSYTDGNLATDTLTLSSSDVFPGFYFSCGFNNGGSKGTAGMMGLGRGMSSIVEQTAWKHKRLFSCCLPSSPSSSGYLIFGASSPKAASKALYTPMIRFKDAASSLYGVKMLAITVAGVRLPIPDTSSTIVDSGATLTILPRSLYSQLKAEFRKRMAQYPLATASGEMDTCYDLSSAGTSVVFPQISLSFNGGAVVNLASGNIMVSETNPPRMCLAFTGYIDKVNILGNVMQKGFEVVHDINGARMGFVPNAC